MRVWNADESDQPILLTGHRDTVQSVAFSPDGERIVTASWDKTARVWDVATAKLIATMNGHTAEVRNAQFSPDGTRIVTASSDNTARIFPVFPTTAALVKHGRSIAPRELTEAQRKRFSLSVK